MIRILAFTICTFFTLQLFAQHDYNAYWQQAVKYEMAIDMDVSNHQFKGIQKIEYTNNSPDALNKVFYHLYFNAFQPGSMMDERNQVLPDADRRVKGRIHNLKEDEVGFLKIISLTQNGKAVKHHTEGTILEVDLADPIEPGEKVVFDMVFDGQVPLQIRRSGRDNFEGIDYSMSQWYPKMCEYDLKGWHTDPYVGREFYGVWGDFKVAITIDASYIIGATGYLVNSDEPSPQSDQGIPNSKDGKRTWVFRASQVHDFVWAADPDYVHFMRPPSEGVPAMHFYVQKQDRTEAWDKLPEVMAEVFKYANQHYGNYPYKKYSFIQGGDGGMEYPLATLITGKRSYESLVGVCVHELMHSWYQMVLGFDESHYPWMDEGFTSYATTNIENYLRSKGLFGNESALPYPFEGTYAGYANFRAGGHSEPLCTHADHYTTNSAYGVAAYVKGAIMPHQLEYIVGKDAFDKGMLEFYNMWKFKHPDDHDFIRVMEKKSGLELDWYLEYWIHTTHAIDYGIKSVNVAEGKKTKVVLVKKEVMPMPVDVEITYTNGEKETYNMALGIMRGNKEEGTEKNKQINAADWPWTRNEYELIIPAKLNKITKIEIDPSKRMADIDRSDNVYSN